MQTYQVLLIKFHILYMQMTSYTFISNLIQKFLTELLEISTVISRNT